MLYYILTMEDYVTKQELEDVLDTKLEQHQAALIGALDHKFRVIDQHFASINEQFAEAKRERDELRESIRELTVTLDAFLKRLTDHEQEFEIMKAELNQLKAIVKEKLGVEVSI